MNNERNTKAVSNYDKRGLAVIQPKPTILSEK
jgi:hypothetical protein